jgi:tRNA-dihydrouridine synthase A|tara:strand:- start:761 stop:1024 length:264 start_codon:yes stop_codon:yes gene_type:complete
MTNDATIDEKSKPEIDAVRHRFCIAPMMDWSDHNCRYFWRLLSKQALLYTEMVTTGALIHGDRKRFLHYLYNETKDSTNIGFVSEDF